MPLMTVNMAQKMVYYSKLNQLLVPPTVKIFQKKLKHFNPELERILGIENLRNPRLNKGLSFTFEERQRLNIHGLLPAKYKTLSEQVKLCYKTFKSYDENINRYQYLAGLSERNEKLFFAFIAENVEETLPILYTPTVGLACQKYGLIYRHPKGLFININDKGHISDVLKNWPLDNIKVIVVTDGERILGLGDLGASGMGIPIGKLQLYTAFAGIRPYECLPILLDVGTNNEALLKDKFYLGLREKRLRGEEYFEFVDEFMTACIKNFGETVLIQFEDFGYTNAGPLLEKYKDKHCVFNDDIQGTAGVILAGLLGASNITKRKLSENTFLFHGAGGAACGIAEICVRAMIREGLSENDAICKIWMIDIDGLVANGRPEGNIDGVKEKFSKDHEPMKDLLKIVNTIKPSILIGASSTGGAFTPEVLKSMATLNERPVIFALSNPNSNAECTPQQAYEHTNGACIFASGSPFPPVKFNDKTYITGQGNNCYIFPGIGLGAVMSRLTRIDDEMFVRAADIVSKSLIVEDLNLGRVYPAIKDIPKLSIKIAVDIMEYAEKQSLTTFNIPEDKIKYIKENQYTLDYLTTLSETWEWPKKEKKKTDYKNEESSQTTRCKFI